MVKNKLFGGRFEPACEYCEFGNTNASGSMIFCENKGVVAPYFSCRKFIYTPLKRIPKKPAVLPKYSDEDFKL